MKKIITTLLFTILLTTLFAQSPPPCGSNPAAGNTCSSPTPICDLNGYCGNTSSSYTANDWGTPETLFGCGFLGLSPCPGTGVYAGFCGSIENNSFLSFTASATTITLDVWVSNCSDGNGIQIMIFETANCNDDVVSYHCNGALSPSPNAQSVTASGLTIGQTYYIMIDGNAGDVCDYTFAANSNSGILVPVYVSPTDTTICAGETVNLVAGGGDGTYNWNASPDLNTTVGSNVVVTPPLTPGSYSYTVNSTSGNTNCPAASTATANITVASCCVIEFIAAAINPTCLNNDGSIDLTITSGSGNYSYDWGGGIISQDLNGIGSGSYTVTVTDITQGCSKDTTIVLSTPNPFSVSAIVAQPTCGNNDGSINLTPNPSGSYSYTWSPNVSSTNSSINLSPDSYQINISQGVCSWDTTITLDVPTNCGCLSPLTLSVDSFFNTKCGGSSACNYSGPSILINEINLVPSANDGSIYGETGTSGVKEGEWIELYNPDWCNAVDISGYILGSYNSTAGAISASNGMGFMLPAGTVVPPLGFVVVRGRNTSVPTSSAIDIIVDDLGGNLCIDGGLTTSRIWFQNAGGWFGFYDASGVPQDIVQWGSTSASDLDGVPCIPPSSPIPSLLSANASGILYNLGATPSTGQTYVRIPDGGNWSTTTQSENSSYGTCNDLVGGCVIGNGGVSTCDGSATVNIVSGGTGPFTYQWNDALNQTTATADSLCPGTYCVTVTDASGICFDTICVEILDSSKITFNVQVNNPTCSNDDGNITLTPDSVGNYNYTWTPNVSSTNTASSLSGGVYQIQVTNGSCAWDTSITLTAPVAFMVSSNIVEPSCLNNDGSISLNPNLPGSYTYTWTPNVSSSNAATNLSSGTYQISVSDGSCDWDTTIIINTPTNSLTISSTLTHATCGNSNGEIIINASNGVGSLDYSIDNGTTSQTGNIFSGLLDGTYDIVVTDSLGCQAQEQVTINMFSSPTITNIIQVDERCTSTDGQITIIASGSSSLNYSIDNGITSQSSNVFSGLSAGTYDVVVTDANGCSITQQIVLGRINTVVANFVATPTNGLAPLEVDFTNQSTGATSYIWIFGDGNTSTLVDPSNTYLTFGDYTATLIATDSLGCSDTATMTIIVTDIFTILVPNIFTPNGDGSNDVFLIESTFIDELNVKIFNRWGNQLFEINSPSDSWDGGDSSDGTYFYVLKAKGKGGEVVEKTGSITLIR